MKIDYAVVGVTVLASLIGVYVANHFFSNLLVATDKTDKSKLAV